MFFVGFTEETNQDIQVAALTVTSLPKYLWAKCVSGFVTDPFSAIK